MNPIPTSEQQGKRTDLAPTVSFMQRAGEALSYLISGVKPNAWFGPLQPLQPMAPPEVQGRNWDYPVGWNIGGGPRIQEGVSFAELRALANTCDILRLAIETRKDQIAAKPWGIRIRVVEGQSAKTKATPEQQARIELIKKFFKRPEPDTDWNGWIRALMEDLFVTDAVTLYPRKTRGGGMYALELIDGVTIKPLLDDQGRAPVAPDPCYQQWLHGIPAVDYTMDELLYLPRNKSSNGVYGYPPVEQILITVNIAIRRSLFQLDYYRVGSQPDAIMSLPGTWSMDQVKAFHDWWQSVLSGSENRRQIRMVPGDFKYQETKAPPLKDEFDEWLSRVICYAFSISPEPFIKQMNRATSESAHDRALEEGLTPLQDWIKGHLDHVIEVFFASPDLEFDFTDDRAQDPEKAAKVHGEYVRSGVLSIDAIREQLGEEPLGGVFATPMVLTANGYVPVDMFQIQQQEKQAAAAAQAAAVAAGAGGVMPDGTPVPAGQVPPGAEAAAAGGPSLDDEVPSLEEEPDEPPPDPDLPSLDEGEDEDEPGDVPSMDEEDDDEDDAEKLAKRAKVIKAPAAVVAQARKSMAAKLRVIFALTAQQVANQIRAGAATKMAKAGPGDWIDLTALRVVLASTEEEATAVARAAGQAALASMGAKASLELVNQINMGASSWAKGHAADLVTQVDKTTRALIQSEVANGLAQGLTEAEIASNIENLNSQVFSEARAETIARYEVGTANSGGALESFKAAREAGVNVKKAWLCDDEACDICRENQDAGAIELDDAFPSGDDSPLAHPNCECALIAITGDEE